MQVGAKRGWRPLLTDDAADDALQVIKAIAAELVPEISSSGADERRVGSASLVSGHAGHALFFHTVAQILDEREKWEDLARTCLKEAARAVATRPMGFDLYGGFTGIAWVVEHLQGQLRLKARGADLSASIDTALHALLINEPWNRSYDLISGLVGLGVYCLDRLPRSMAQANLELIVGHLEKIAEDRGEEGVAWFTPSETLDQWSRLVSPAGHYDLGVAHGVSGVLPFLAAACRAGVRESLARRLLEGGVQRLLSYWDRAGKGACFPYRISPNKNPSPARLGWCYGDAGMAAALLKTARLATRQDWEKDALDIGERAAMRPIGEAGVRDGGLCHGAFGLAHLFNRLYQASDRPLFADAAQQWLRQGLDSRRPGQGMAGFMAWEVRTPGGPPTWLAESGFLTGAGGIGMALAAAIARQEPKWDRLLLADIPSE